MLQPKAGRSVWPKVELADQHERADFAVVLKGPVDRAHVPARQRRAVIARVGPARDREPVTVAFVCEVTPGAQVQQLVWIQGATHLDSEPPLWSQELKLISTEVVSGLSNEGCAGRHITSVRVLARAQETRGMVLKARALHGEWSWPRKR